MSRTSSSTERPPASARDDRIGLLLLSLVAGVMLCLVGASLAMGDVKSVYYIPVGFLLLAGACFPLRSSRRANAALLLTVLTPFPWLADTFLGWLTRGQAAVTQQAKQSYAADAGISFDARSPLQVVLDLRREGRDAWPAVHPAVLLETMPDGSRSVVRTDEGEELLPLGGIANVPTVYGNEDGRYLIYQSDEHGFHNPSGVWDLPRIDIAAVGDSFTQGASVPSSRNLIASIRRRWPSTLNLGYGGNGPLIELASLLEYLPQRRPRVVLWVLCERNDLGEDLGREMTSALLQRYWIERRKVQNLEQRQAEIDKLLRGYVDRAIVIETGPSESGSSWWAWVKLVRLRQTAYRVIKRPPDQWDTLTEVLRTARDQVRAWQGQLYLVYLPVHQGSREPWLTRYQRGEPEERHERALEVGRVLGIPVIDVEPVFRQAGSRVNTFVYPYPGHFTAAGYEEIGSTIVKRLEADGF